MIITLEDKLEILTELMSSSDVTGNRVFTKFNPIWFDNKAAVISTNKNFLESIRHQIAKMDKLLSEEEGSDLDVDLMDKSDEYIPVMAILYEEFMGYLKTLEGEKIIRIVDIPTDEGFKLLPVRLEGNYILELFKEIHPAYEALC
ncbi:MAG: hypothetical protein WCQ47_07105, partial [bacterium]